jgi:hypothetical protein
VQEQEQELELGLRGQEQEYRHLSGPHHLRLNHEGDCSAHLMGWDQPEDVSRRSTVEESAHCSQWTALCSTWT